MDDIQKLILCLKNSPIFLENLIKDIPHEELKIQRRKNRWSAHEHACHVCIGDKYGFHKRFILFKDENVPTIQPISGDDFPQSFYLDLDITECLQEFKLLRKKTIELVKYREIDFWEKEANHPEYKKYTPLIMLKHLLMHDHFHFYNIEELLLVKDEYLETI